MPLPDDNPQGTVRAAGALLGVAERESVCATTWLIPWPPLCAFVGAAGFALWSASAGQWLAAAAWTIAAVLAVVLVATSVIRDMRSEEGEWRTVRQALQHGSTVPRDTREGALP